jgi:hypothetical protein
MRLLPRLRLLLARRPWLYWLAVGVCAAAIWVSMSAAERSVARERSQWGTTQRVWVTDEAVATGEPIVASARDLPLAMLPAAAVTAPPTGVAAHPLAEGEVVVATDLVDDGGLAPAEWLVFAVPADGSPALAAGDACGRVRERPAVVRRRGGRARRADGGGRGGARLCGRC